jgi:N-methylhydantoinase B/oxoprolinase/acetone carboxylase alpha subunit
MNKMKSFVKEVVAIIQGDNAEATGQKILRQAESAFKTQIAALNGDTIALEDKVEDAKENLRLARLNNGVVISDRNDYVRKLLEAQNALTAAEEALETHNEKLAFLEEQHKLLD